jgi:murein tripeptide amidase MpaA
MSYLNVQEVESAVTNLATAYSSLCELISLPFQTHEGRTCHALRIGKKPKIECDNVFIIGGVHAREWGSCEICVSFASDLLEAYVTNVGLQYGGKTFSNNQIRTIIENLNLIVFPDVNPDGRNYSQTSTTPLWRKNRNPIAGVDINRNFDFLWDYPNLFSSLAQVEPYTSTDPSSYQYHGPFPFSEPDTRNVLWLFDEFPRIRWFMDIHSYSQLVLYNWGDDQNQTNNASMNFRNSSFNSVRGIRNDTAYLEFIPACDLARVIPQANEMKNSITSVRGKNYIVEQSFDLYLTCGTSIDYVYSRCYTNPSKEKIQGFTIEWGTDFQPPWIEMEQIILDISSALVTFCL